MPYTTTVVRILIASPSDVSAERDAVSEVISNWNVSHSRDYGITLVPVRWETHATPELGERPQAIINRQLVDDCDALVGVFWARLGTPTGVAESGTAEEIERFRARGKHVLLYFSGAPVEQSKLDPGEYARLQEYKARLRSQGLFDTYSSVPELREKLLRHLSDVARRFTTIVTLKAAAPAAPEQQAAEFSDEETQTLRVLAEFDDYVEPEDVAEKLKVSPERAKYLLDDLADREYVEISEAVDRPDLYILARKGRALLGRRNLL